MDDPGHIFRVPSWSDRRIGHLPPSCRGGGVPVHHDPMHGIGANLGNREWEPFQLSFFVVCEYMVSYSYVLYSTIPGHVSDRAHGHPCTYWMQLLPCAAKVARARGPLHCDGNFLVLLLHSTVSLTASQSDSLTLQCSYDRTVVLATAY